MKARVSSVACTARTADIQGGKIEICNCYRTLGRVWFRRCVCAQRRKVA